MTVPRVYEATPGAAYATLRQGEFGRTIDVGDGSDVMVDVDPDGCVLGVEVLDGSDWRDALVSLVMAGGLRVVPKQPPVLVAGGRVIIEWPPPRKDGMPGWGVSLFDADTGKQIKTAMRLTVDPEDVIKATATVFAGTDGNPVFDGDPVATEDGTGIRTVDVKFIVTAVRIAEAPA